MNSAIEAGMTDEKLLQELLSPSKSSVMFASMSRWFEAYRAWHNDYPRAIDLAIIGGRKSNSVAYAFAAGYQAAIMALFREEPVGLSSLCVTEAQGNHPRHIETALTLKGDVLMLNGSKTFISGAQEAEMMYVACLDKRTGNGLDNNGRPMIKIVRVPTCLEGISITRMPELGFIPEVTHGSVVMSEVQIDDSSVLNGDGYLDYVKPFRTYEDLFVTSALVAYRMGEAVDKNWGTDLVEAHLSLILALKQISGLSLRSPVAHIAFSACRTAFHQLIKQTDPIFEKNAPEKYQRWERDKKLLGVAAKAHLQRTENAWLNFLSVSH